MRRTVFTKLHTFLFLEEYLNRCFTKRKGVLGESFYWADLGEIQGVGELGLILEHEIDRESDQFEKLVDEIKVSLNELGWNYDGWVGEDVEQAMVH